MNFALKMLGETRVIMLLSFFRDFASRVVAGESRFFKYVVKLFQNNREYLAHTRVKGEKNIGHQNKDQLVQNQSSDLIWRKPSN
jgi:hypothetical protein